MHFYPFKWLHCFGCQDLILNSLQQYSSQFYTSTSFLQNRPGSFFFDIWHISAALLRQMLMVCPPLSNRKITHISLELMASTDSSSAPGSSWGQHPSKLQVAKWELLCCTTAASELYFMHSVRRDEPAKTPLMWRGPMHSLQVSALV